MRVTAQNRDKFTKNPYFGVQGHSRSSMLTSLRSSLLAFVIISSMSVPICNYFHVRRANSGRITNVFSEGCFFFAPSFVGTLFTQRHEILSRNTRDTKVSYGENQKFLSQLVLKRYRVVTDRRTELF